MKGRKRETEEESNWEGGGGGEQILIVGHRGGSGGQILTLGHLRSSVVVFQSAVKCEKMSSNQGNPNNIEAVYLLKTVLLHLY